MDQPVRRGADRRRGPSVAHRLAVSPGHHKPQVSLEEMRNLPTRFLLQLKTKRFCFPWLLNWRGPRMPWLGAGTRNLLVISQCRGGLWGQLWSGWARMSAAAPPVPPRLDKREPRRLESVLMEGRPHVGASALWLRPSADPLCQSAAHSAHSLMAQLLSPKVKDCDGSHAQGHQQHWPSGSRPNSEVQLRPVGTLSAVLQGGPRVTSKWQCHDAGQQDSAWRIARLSGDTPTHEHFWPWVRQSPEQADNCREQSPWHRQGATIPGHGRGPTSGGALGIPQLKHKEASGTGGRNSLGAAFKSCRAGHAGEWRPEGMYHRKQSVWGTDGLGWSWAQGGWESGLRNPVCLSLVSAS